jgi:hypothetical protein
VNFIKYRSRLEAARFALTGKVGRVDPDLERMMEVAHDLDARSYSGGWVQLLNYQDLETVAAAVNTFTTTTCIVSPTPRAFIPANSVSIGTQFRIRGWGTVSSAAGTATTTIGIALNGTAGTVICASAAQTPATTTVFTIWLEFHATVLTVGSSGTIIGGGIAHGMNATPTTPILIPATAPASVTMNTTQANSITVNATWSASSGSNTYTLYAFSCEQLN